MSEIHEMFLFGMQEICLRVMPYLSAMIIVLCGIELTNTMRSKTKKEKSVIRIIIVALSVMLRIAFVLIFIKPAIFFFPVFDSDPPLALALIPISPWLLLAAVAILIVGFGSAINVIFEEVKERRRREICQ